MHRKCKSAGQRTNRGGARPMAREGFMGKQIDDWHRHLCTVEQGDRRHHTRVIDGGPGSAAGTSGWRANAEEEDGKRCRTIGKRCRD